MMPPSIGASGSGYRAMPCHRCQCWVWRAPGQSAAEESVRKCHKCEEEEKEQEARNEAQQ